jgi:hypothetical protein
MPWALSNETTSTIAETFGEKLDLGKESAYRPGQTHTTDSYILSGYKTATGR